MIIPINGSNNVNFNSHSNQDPKEKLNELANKMKQELKGANPDISLIRKQEAKFHHLATTIMKNDPVGADNLCNNLNQSIEDYFQNPDSTQAQKGALNALNNANRILQNY